MIRTSEMLDSGSGSKWLNSGIIYREGTLTDVYEQIPIFERRTFAITQPDNQRSRLNEKLDTIVRLPLGDDQSYVPIGVVSKAYTLVQHKEVFEAATKALEDSKIPASEVKASLNITEYGERMELSFCLPAQYNFDPGDGYPMALRMELLNSVDGSTRFQALLGWFRFVCSNGLIIGVTQSDIRYRHAGELQLGDVQNVLNAGLKKSDTEKKNFEDWRKKAISPNSLISWVNENLKKEWGFKAAARAFCIARTGFDGEILGQYKGNQPTTILMKKTKHVPGSPKKCDNLFDVSQILAWLAKERRDVQEQLQWREQIPELLKPLST